MRHIKTIICFSITGIMMLGIPASAKKTKLEVWVNGWSPFKVLQEAIKGFEKQNPNVDVVVSTPGIQTDLYQKLIARVAAGTAPDLLTLQSPIAQLSDKGFLTPLNSYLKSSKTIKTSDYHKELLDIYSTTGTIYAIPSIESGPELGLVYNETNFAEAGLDPNTPPKTLDELKVFHHKLTKIDPGTGAVLKFGIDPISSMGDLYFPELWGPIFDTICMNKATGRPLFDVPGLLKAVEYTASFRDITNNRAFNSWKTKASEWGPNLGKGWQAMEINGYWAPKQAILTNKDAKINATWMPNTRGDKMMVLGGWALGIAKGSKNSALAWKLIEYMAGAEPSQKILDGMGYLTGNQRTLRELDFSKQPESAWYIKSMMSADRIVAHPDVPEWDKCKELLRSGIRRVMNKQVSASDMLKKVQNESDILLDKYYKHAAKYRR